MVTQATKVEEPTAVSSGSTYRTGTDAPNAAASVSTEELRNAGAPEHSRPVRIAVKRRTRASASAAADRNGGSVGNSTVVAAQDITLPTDAAISRDERNELYRLSAQHLAIQEAERKRVAADLHDGLGQALSLVNLSIERALSLLRAGSTEEAAVCLERLKPRMKEAVDEVRRIAMNLRPATLDNLGIVATLSWYFRDFNANFPAIYLDSECGIAESEIPHPIKLPIFRIVQEATSNTVKHASADRIRLRLVKHDDAIELLVEDDGTGFNADEVAERGEWFRCLGLRSMRERAQLSGGAFRLESAPAHGTRILVCWSLPHGEREAARGAGLTVVRNRGSSELTDPHGVTELDKRPDRIVTGRSDSHIE